MPAYCTHHVRIIGLLIGTLFCSLTRSQWQQTNGPEGGSITSLSSAFGVVYAAGIWGCVFRSDEPGTHWTNVGTELAPLHPRIVSSAGSVLLVATDLGGVRYSTDQGSSWNPSSGIPAGASVQDISHHGTSDYASTSEGLFVSTNNGMNWTLRSPEMVNSVRSLGSRMIGGKGSSGVVISDDDGSSWSYSNAGLPSQIIFGQAHYPSPLQFGVRSGTVFMASSEGLFRSDDNGANWALVAFENEWASAVLVLEDTLIVAKGSTIEVSLDDGLSWSSHEVDANNVQIAALVRHNACLLVGTDNGVYRSTDLAVTWERTSGLINSSTSVIESDGSRLVVGDVGSDRGGLFYSTDEAGTWQTSNGCAPRYSVTGCVRSDNAWYACLELNGTNTGTSIGVFVSTDDAESWEQVYFYPWDAISAKDGVLFGGGWNGVMLSTNGGTSWTLANGFPFANMGIQCFHQEGNVVYAGSINFGVYRSYDNGSNWVGPDQSFDEEVNAITSSGGSLFAATAENGIFRSSDGGGTWIPCNAGLPVAFVSHLAKAGDLILAAVDQHGVYVSSDLGAYWYPANDGLFNPHASDFAVQGDSVYVGTRGSGVFATSIAWLTQQVGFAESNAVSDEFGTVYPNPAKGHTTVSLKLKTSAIVHLEQLDLLGRSLSKKTVSCPAGEQKLPLELSAIGPVLIRITIGGTTYHKRVINSANE